MTIRNLDFFFKPRSVVLIGVSARAHSVGNVLASNLMSGGFKGQVHLVNPNYQDIDGVPVLNDIGDLPAPAELAIIATPPATVPGIIARLAHAGTRAAIVVTAGFAELSGQDGAALVQAMLVAARPHLLRVIGPNCIGIMVPHLGLNASFAHTDPSPGRIAFVAQSGAIVTSVLDWAKSREIGFSHLVSLGNMADVDFGDMLDYLASDLHAQAILLYIEAVTNARKFMSAARAAARSKPVIVVKAGRFSEGARAAASHTGAMTGMDAVYDAAIRRAGMLRVNTLTELFDAVESVAIGNWPMSDRLAILTNGGGLGVLATDALIEHRGRLAELAAETVTKLDSVLPPAWSHTNPVDIMGDAPGGRYAAALDALLDDPNVDATLVLNCPTAVASGTEAAQAVIDTVKAHGGSRLVTSWVGEAAAATARRLFIENGVPTYDTPEEAVATLMHRVEYQRNQELLMQTPPSVPEAFSPDTAAAREIIGRALEARRHWLTEPEAKAVLSAYGIASVPTVVADSPEAAGRAAKAIGGPVALKILSADITHKSDVGGVALDLEDEAAVREAAHGMLKRVKAARPETRVQGFTVQPMARLPGSVELILGVIEDREFGPVLLFGQGGTAVEAIDDKALGLPPLNLHLALEMMRRTRVWRLLQGVRERPRADLDAVALTLVRLSQLVVDLGEVIELDINPLLANASGVIALDARIRIAPSADPAQRRLAIRPYPKELEEEVALGDGRTLLLRPIVPEDEPSLQRAFATLTDEEIYMRFLVPLKFLSHVRAARFTQIDYDRQMALVLTERGIPGTTDISGIVQVLADPDNENAEFALIVHHAMTGLGLGMFLMRRIIDYARNRGIGELYGDVLAENRPMLKLCEVLGFVRSRIPEEHEIVRVTLKLDDPVTARAGLTARPG
jgi:acetyltransferase